MKFIKWKIFERLFWIENVLYKKSLDNISLKYAESCDNIE